MFYIYIFFGFIDRTAEDMTGFIDKTAEDMTGNRQRERGGNDTQQGDAGRESNPNPLKWRPRAVKVNNSLTQHSLNAIDFFNARLRLGIKKKKRMCVV